MPHSPTSRRWLGIAASPIARHESEPGCAVLAAIDGGALPAARLASHRKLEAELRSVALRADVRRERAEGRRLGRFYRQHGKLAERNKRGEV